MTIEPLSDQDAAGFLKSGGVLLMGTDTLPGFHCRADLDPAVNRIMALKGRQVGKSLVVLAGSVEQACLVTGPLETRQADYCRKCWPGPFSLILPAGGELAKMVASEEGTVAVRVPAVGSLRALLLQVGFPLVSTSANLTGKPPFTDIGRAWVEFRNSIDGFWQPEEIKADGEFKDGARPSSLVNLSVWPPEVLRVGPVEPPVAG